MGKVLLVARLTARDLRHHKAQAVLLLLAITAATTVLAMSFALRGVTSRPYQQTRAATSGPDVVAYLPVLRQPGQQAQRPAEATTLVHDPGVSGYSGPYPLASAVLRVHGLKIGVEAEGRTPARAAVDQPKLTAGRWVSPGGVVIERTFAEALGVGVGDRITLDGQPYTVAGIAVTAANPPYPNLCYAGAGGCYGGFSGPGLANPGLIWMPEPAASHLAAAADWPGTYVLNLRLSDPASAQAFASRYGSAGPGPGAQLASWQVIAAADGLLVQDEQQVLTPGAVLLGLLALASVAVLVGGRLAEHTRRVGLLKAVGATPRLVAATFLAENLVLALVAATVGLAVGWLAAPLITSPGVALVGTPGAPSLTLPSAVEVFIVALAVALAATLAPAIRAARTSTVSALADVARPPRRRSALIGISRRLPVPVLFGLRLVARRPRRALLSAASVAVTVAGIVAVLAFHATVHKGTSGASAGGLPNPVAIRDEQMLVVITIVLVTLAVLNAIFTAWATVLDARRPAALMRALGARSRQVDAGLSAAQVIPALPGALLGIPLGIGLFAAANGAGIVTVPPASWLLATVLGTLVAVAGLTIIPARIGGRRSVAEILRSETA